MSNDEDLDLIRKLGHEVTMQAAGTKDSERVWIAEAASVIGRLASDDSADEDRAEARTLLAEIPALGA